jgi:hypothetical protein
VTTAIEADCMETLISGHHFSKRVSLVCLYMHQVGQRRHIYLKVSFTPIFGHSLAGTTLGEEEFDLSLFLSLQASSYGSSAENEF